MCVCVCVRACMYLCMYIGPFRHSDISVKAVNQHGGNLYCVTLTYVRLRSGHMTHEKGLYVCIHQYV